MYQGFGQAKTVCGGFILSSSKFQVLPTPEIAKSAHVRSDTKMIISLFYQGLLYVPDTLYRIPKLL